MPEKTRIVAPGPSERSVRTADGQILQAPDDWALLPPGDADAWIAAITDVANWSASQREAFVDNASRTAIKVYNWDRVAAETMACYQLPHPSSP